MLNYGNLPNDLLLLDYGFVIPGNPFETVQLRFDPGLIEVSRAYPTRCALQAAYLGVFDPCGREFREAPGRCAVVLVI